MEKPTHSLIYKGSIPEAINEARRQKKLFIVYISGEDESSILLEQSTWVDENVHETILKYCVFLHLIEGSLDASQFSAIYPNNAIPSISVINGLNGVKLWNHEGYISAESLKENIEKSLATMHLQDTAATLLATAALATQNPPQPGLLSSNAPSTSQNETGQLNNDPFAEREVGPTENDESSVKADVLTAASSAKPEPGKNTEKEDNLNISSVEKSTESSPDDADVITSASSSNKNRTKQEEKVTVPISTVEKSTSSSPNNADVITAASSAKPQPDKIAKNKNKMKREEKEIVPVVRVEKSNDVLVSVKMPEGTSHQIKLTKSDALRSVRNFVDQNLTVGFGPYCLAVPYPRKLFTEQDMDKTLSELGFSTREALIVISEKSLGAKSSFDPNITNRDISNESNNEGYFGKLRRIISYVNPFSYFGGNYEALDENTNREESPFSQERSQQDGQTSVNSRYRTGTGTGTGTSSKPFGSNIHTLRQDNEGEASNNRNMFWNGNSTQFGGDNNNNNNDDGNNNK